MQMQPLLNGKCIEEPLFNSIDHVYLIWGQLIISQSTFVAASAMLIFCLGYIVVSKAPIMILSNLCSRLNVLSLFKKKNRQISASEGRETTVSTAEVRMVRD